MITSTIHFPHSLQLAALLHAEEGSFRHPRTRYKVIEQRDRIMVTISADDATALKTVVSSVCRVASVFEKAQRV